MTFPSTTLPLRYQPRTLDTLTVAEARVITSAMSGRYVLNFDADNQTVQPLELCPITGWLMPLELN